MSGRVKQEYVYDQYSQTSEHFDWFDLHAVNGIIYPRTENDAIYNDYVQYTKHYPNQGASDPGNDSVDSDTTASTVPLPRLRRVASEESVNSPDVEVVPDSIDMNLSPSSSSPYSSWSGLSEGQLYSSRSSAKSVDGRHSQGSTVTTAAAPVAFG